MSVKIIKRLRQRDHWYAEWWSSIFLISVGIYGVCISDNFMMQPSFIHGFLKFLPVHLWELLFIMVGFLQFCMLSSESIYGRGIAAFLSSSLLIWGTLNIIFYGQWHFSFIAWGVFASINLYALSRIARGIEKHYEHL